LDNLNLEKISNSNNLIILYAIGNNSNYPAKSFVLEYKNTDQETLNKLSLIVHIFVQLLMIKNIPHTIVFRNNKIFIFPRKSLPIGEFGQSYAGAEYAGYILMTANELLYTRYGKEHMSLDELKNIEDRIIKNDKLAEEEKKGFIKDAFNSITLEEICDGFNKLNIIEDGAFDDLKKDFVAIFKLLSNSLHSLNIEKLITETPHIKDKYVLLCLLKVMIDYESQREIFDLINSILEEVMMTKYLEQIDSQKIPLEINFEIIIENAPINESEKKFLRKLLEIDTQDPSRPLPGKPTPTQEEVLVEIKRHNINTFEVITLQSPELKLALEYLRSINEYQMASYLEYLAKQGLIRAGPLKGFLATTYQDDQGTEYILLSNLYPEYNNMAQRTLSLIHEIGATSKFKKSHQENEEKGDRFVKDLIKKLEAEEYSVRQRAFDALMELNTLSLELEIRKYIVDLNDTRISNDTKISAVTFLASMDFETKEYLITLLGEIERDKLLLLIENIGQLLTYEKWVHYGGSPGGPVGRGGDYMPEVEPWDEEIGAPVRKNSKIVITLITQALLVKDSGIDLYKAKQEALAKIAAKKAAEEKSRQEAMKRAEEEARRKAEEERIADEKRAEEARIAAEKARQAEEARIVAAGAQEWVNIYRYGKDDKKKELISILFKIHRRAILALETLLDYEKWVHHEAEYENEYDWVDIEYHAVGRGGDSIPSMVYGNVIGQRLVREAYDEDQGVDVRITTINILTEIYLELTKSGVRPDISKLEKKLEDKNERVCQAAKETLKKIKLHLPRDLSRPLPGQPMPTKEEILKEIRHYNIGRFEIIHIDSEEVQMALNYLRGIKEEKMAQYLEYLAKQGLIRAGPLKGFLATTYQDDQGT
ncbi:MAG: hypothetical protein NC904_09040, partial [Candidatus Omnitrophica bacterium]|nr:hypothetical protein [Candidatus Omnitrophota bacterium]